MRKHGVKFRLGVGGKMEGKEKNKSLSQEPRGLWKVLLCDSLSLIPGATLVHLGHDQIQLIVSLFKIQLFIS